MQACPRRFCGGALVAWHEGCTLCGRTATGPRPPTAKEKGDRRLQKPNVTNYFNVLLRCQVWQRRFKDAFNPANAFRVCCYHSLLRVHSNART